MPSYNRITIVGHLGNDAKADAFGENTKYSFSVATSDRRKNGGEWVDATTWHGCEAWNVKPDWKASGLVKGALVLVEGALYKDEWTDKEGVKRTKAYIAVTRIELLDKRGESAAPRGSSAPASDPQPPAPDADLPF